MSSFLIHVFFTCMAHRFKQSYQLSLSGKLSSSTRAIYLFPYQKILGSYSQISMNDPTMWGAVWSLPYSPGKYGAWIILTLYTFYLEHTDTPISAVKHRKLNHSKWFLCSVCFNL